MANTLLSCSGFRIGEVWIPRFEVFTEEHVGLALPCWSSFPLTELCNILVGTIPKSGVRAFGKTMAVALPGLSRVEGSQTVIEFISSRALASVHAGAIVRDLDIELTSHYGLLPYTSRVIIDLRIAWTQQPQLLVFSTSGLDPLGERDVGAEVKRWQRQCSALHVFCEPSVPCEDDRYECTKVVRCIPFVPGK